MVPPIPWLAHNLHTLSFIFRALLVCFIICGLLATILIAIHDWGKPVDQCDLAQETFQKSQLYNTVLRIKNHERSQVSLILTQSGEADRETFLERTRLRYATLRAKVYETLYKFAIFIN